MGTTGVLRKTAAGLVAAAGLAAGFGLVAHGNPASTSAALRACEGQFQQRVGQAQAAFALTQDQAALQAAIAAARASYDNCVAAVPLPDTPGVPLPTGVPTTAGVPTSIPQVTLPDTVRPSIPTLPVSPPSLPVPVPLPLLNGFFLA